MKKILIELFHDGTFIKDSYLASLNCQPYNNIIYIEIDNLSIAVICAKFNDSFDAKHVTKIMHHQSVIAQYVFGI